MQSSTDTHNEAVRYLGLCWRRKWLIALPAILCAVSTALYSMRLPDRFRSSTVILVTPQRVPESFVPSTVTTDVEDRLNTIRQQILSRTRLEQIIQEFQVFPEQRATAPMETLVDVMRRERIGVSVQRGRGTQAFEVSFQDTNPRVAMLVTNRLAALFIEENLKVREQQAMGTSVFLADEIEAHRARIREREKAISAFRLARMDELPERLASNQARLTQLQSQLQINAQGVNASEDRKVLLQQQIAEVERRVQEEIQRRAEALSAAPASVDASAAEGPAPHVTPLELPVEREVVRARDELSRLKLSFTEKHPDVARLSALVQQLEARAREERDALPQTPVGAIAGPVAPQAPVPPPTVVRPAPVEYPEVYHRMVSDVLALERQVERSKEESARIRQEIETYQARIAATPLREMELRQLSEDYESLKAAVTRLVENKLQADLSENLERKQKGEQFKILDPANLPEKPVSPNRAKMIAVALVLGLGLGFGVVFLLDAMTPGVRSREELARELDLPVLGVIPEIVTASDLRRRRLVRVAAGGAMVAVCVGVIALVHWTVRPLPEAVRELYGHAARTHWTAMK